MKKNILRILIAIGGYALFLPNVYAESGSLTVACDKQTAEPGSTINCTLSATADFATSGWEIPFVLDSKLTATGFTLNTNTGYDIAGGSISPDNKIGIYNGNADGVPANTTINLGTLKIKVNSNVSAGTANIAFNNIIFNDNTSSLAEHSIPDTSTSISIAVPTGLTNIEASGGTFGIQFTPENKVYMLTLASGTTTFSLKATPANAGDVDTIILRNVNTNETYTNNGEITYAPAAGQSSMSINIIVGTGENQVTYTVNVARTEPVSTGGATLKLLTVNGRGVALKNDSSSSENVSVSVSEASNYQLKAVLSDSSNYKFQDNSQCSVSGDTMTCNLSRAGNISIGVTSKNSGGASKTYNLTINAISNNIDVGSNPQTGTGALIIGIVLVISLGISLYLYKKNINGYN